MNSSLVNSFDFPRSKRITSGNQYRVLLRKGKKLVTEHFICHFICQDHSCSRLGIAIAKSKIPLAVWRNRIKRMIRESFRKKQFQKQYDIIVSANRAFHQLPRSSQWQCLERLWEKIDCEKNEIS